MTHCDSKHFEKRIVQHYKTIAQQQESITVNHCIGENISPQTIYSIIQKYDTSDIVGGRSRSDRPKKNLNWPTNTLKKTSESSSRNLNEKYSSKVQQFNGS